MKRRQHIVDALKSPCTLHLIPPDLYVSSHIIRVDHHRMEEALRSLGSIEFIASADHRPAPGSGYGYIKSYVIAIVGLPPEEARRRFTDMPSRRPTPPQYRVVDIIAAAVHDVRSSGKPYRREVDEPHLNTSLRVAQHITSAETLPMSVVRRRPQASTLLNAIRTSGERLASRDLDRVSRMDYVLQGDIRTACDLVRFIGGNGPGEVIFGE